MGRGGGSILRGVVETGRGEAELYVNLYAREFERYLGFRPYPGTLNIRLHEDYASRRRKLLSCLKPIVIPPPPVMPGLAKVYCYHAVLR
ncbi:MAG: DUF120 domain-containing protein, partial [Candidatus Korarchaeota archaeon]|nr:DUF120 domain-containing protein [Candidatus Korarchaeota archaeon]